MCIFLCRKVNIPVLNGWYIQKRGGEADDIVIQMSRASEVRPNISTHPAFGRAWEEAVDAGVRIWFFGCTATENSLIVDERRVFAEE